MVASIRQVHCVPRIHEYNFNFHSATLPKDALLTLASIKILYHILTRHEFKLEELNVSIIDAKKPDKRQRLLK
jgi:hypothetical protein